MSDAGDEFEALLIRIRSAETRRAADALFAAEPLDLSLTYLPDNFCRPDTRLDSKLNDTISKK